MYTLLFVWRRSLRKGYEPMKKRCYIRWFSVICILVFMMGSFPLSQAAEEGKLEQIRLSLSGDTEAMVRELVLDSHEFISLNVDTEESNLCYQWQYLPEGSKKWINWPGRTTAFLYEMAEDRMDGWKIRCKVTGTGKEEKTEIVSLTVKPVILCITTDFPDGGKERLFGAYYSHMLKGDEGECYTITIKCSRDDLSYQWIWNDRWDSNDGTELAGETKSSIRVRLDPALNGKYLNCIIRDSKGRELFLRDHCLYKNETLCMRAVPKKATAEKTIYGISSYWLKYISIPENYPTKIDVSGKNCTVISGESAEVKNGCIVPVMQTWSSSDGSQDTEPEFGDTLFRMDGEETLRVHVDDYAQVYAEKVMDDYLAENITPGMTDREKAEACCRFVCSYDYSDESSGYIGLILRKGGDCWASTAALMYMFGKLGIKAEKHDSRNVMGGMAGHFNVSAVLDGKYCIVEAGYDGTAPRFYSIETYQSIFAYRVLEDGKSIEITALNNAEQAESITVPSTIDGYTVRRLDDGAFRSHREVTSVTLPDTLEEIGEYAFSACGIRTITIPGTATAVCGSSFAQCDSLERIEIAGEGKDCLVYDGVLYGNGGKQLLCCPAARTGDVEIRGGTEQIDSCAFLGVSLDSVQFPSTLKSVGDYAFSGAWIQKAVFAEGIETIPENCLNRAQVSIVSLPQSVKTIGKAAFLDSGLQAVTLPENLEAIGESAFAGTAITQIRIPDSVRVIEDKAFRLNRGENNKTLIIFSSEHGEITLGQDVFSGTLLGVYDGSRVHEYAKQNNIPYILLEKNGRIPLNRSWFTTEIPDQQWTGEAVHPEFSFLPDSSMIELKEDRDYKMIWGENTEPGQGTVTVEGQGVFTGSFTVSFEIIGGPQKPEPEPEPDPVQPDPEPADKVEAYVYRCYKIILGRTPDAGGLKTWYNELTSGRKTASEIIDRFVNSPEYINKHYNYGDSVDILYQAMLGRNADAGGKANWVKKLESGQTLAHVINGFCFSNEFRGLCDSYGIKAGFVNIENTDTTAEGKIKAFVQRCYRIILDREADPSGMQTWYEQLSSGKKAAAEIIDRFVNSPEFSGKNYSPEDAVEILYKAMLGRSSDAAGKFNWVMKLVFGQPFAVVINGFCVSKEFTGICASYGIKPGNVNIRLSAQSEEELSMLALNAKEPITRRSETKPNRVEIINPSDTIDMNIGTAVQAVYINEEKAKEFIGRCYKLILGREASEAELENWIGQMVNGTKTPDQIARGFLFSNEFKAKNVSSEELVKILYRVYMNRDADPEGLKTWTEKLDGGMELKDLLDTFSKTNEFKKVVSEMSK